MYYFFLRSCFSVLFLLFFFFKQKTAYDMRISDWSSDVCSSDLTGLARPSLYNAFGDKLSLYRKALAFSLSEIHALARSELRNFADIQTELGTFFENLLALYRAPDGAGLLILCTAPAEADMRQRVGEDLRVIIAALAQLLETRLEAVADIGRSEEHTSELQSLMRIPYAVFCLKKQNQKQN